MRRDSSFAVGPSVQDEAKVTMGEMAVAIGWTLTLTLFGFVLAGLAALYYI